MFTTLACGFDFKLSQNADFYCVDVKGINLKSGNVMMKEKEFFCSKWIKMARTSPISKTIFLLERGGHLTVISDVLQFCSQILFLFTIFQL
jgi:hypothetical protein